MQSSVITEFSSDTEVEIVSENGDVENSGLDEDKRLHICRKLAYASGGLPMQLLSNIVAFFTPIFFLETVKLAPRIIAMLLLIARASDAITDPIMGYLVMKTNTPIGSKRPWLLFSIPIFAISFMLMFYSVEIPSESAKFAIYAVVVVFLQIGLTAFHVPYSSMTIVLTNIPQERDSLTAFRMAAEVSAVLIGSLFFGSLTTTKRVTNIYQNVADAIDVESLGASALGVVPVNTSDANATIGIIPPEVVQAEVDAYLLAAGVNCVIAVVAAAVCFFGTREVTSSTSQSTEHEQNEATLGYFWAVRRILSFRPYLCLMASFLFVSLGIQIVQGTIPHYITHRLKMSSYMAGGIMALLASAIVLIPVCQRLALCIGKKSTLAVGILNMFPILVVVFFLPERPPLVVFFGVLVWAGFTVSVAMLLPWSMLPDVIDAFALIHGTRKEAIFYSLIVFFNKLAVGISLAMSTGILGLVGYDVNKPAFTQNPMVGEATRYMCSVAPAICLTLSLVFLYLYPLGTSEVTELRGKLLRRSQDRCLEISKAESAAAAAAAAAAGDGPLPQEA